MATITLSLSSYASGTSSSFKEKARVQVDYSIGVGSVTVTNVRCLAGNGYRTYENGSITVKVGNNSKTISGIVDFGANDYVHFANYNFKTTGLGSSASISVHTSAPTVYNIQDSYFNGAISGITQVYKPTLSALTTSNLTDKSVFASYSITNTGNASCDKNIEIFSDSGLGTRVGYVANTSATFYGLDANRDYWLRGNSGNSAGRTYTNIVKITTNYINPGAPGALALSYTGTSPTPQSQLKASWVAAVDGSTPVAGYKLTLFKNDSPIKVIETNDVLTTFNFGTFEELGCGVNDTVKVGIYAYSLDWKGNKHYNGNGDTTSQVFSTTTITIVSDKFIYASINGASFEKRKIFISIDGGDFIEVKKENLKIIK